MGDEDGERFVTWKDYEDRRRREFFLTVGAVAGVLSFLTFAVAQMVALNLDIIRVENAYIEMCRHLGDVTQVIDEHQKAINGDRVRPGPECTEFERLRDAIKGPLE